MLRQQASFVITLALLGCGGSAPPAAEPGVETTPSAEAPPAEGAPAPSAGGTIEDQRPAFMESCATKGRSREFCTCGFEQFKEVFKDADLTKPLDKADPRVTELQKKTTTACASKLSEADVKEGFMHSCVAGEERKNAYCTCAWASMRKKLPHTAFVGSDEDDPRLVEPTKAMVIECKGKFPVEVAKFEFMGACTDGDSALEPGCSCRWDKLKKQFTTEEIVAGTVDVTTAKGLADCKDGAGGAKKK